MGTTVKFILSSTISDPMQQYYDGINRRAEEIENLREAASFALNLEHKYKIEEIATVLSKLYEKAVTHVETPEAKAILCKYPKTAPIFSNCPFNNWKPWHGTSPIHEFRNWPCFYDSLPMILRVKRSSTIHRESTSQHAIIGNTEPLSFSSRHGNAKYVYLFKWNMVDISII